MPSLGRFVVAVVLALVGFGRAAAVAPEIKDDAKLFSPEAIKKTNAELRDIYRTYRKDFLLESFASVAGDQMEKVKAMSPKDRADFFRKWAQERAKERVVRGVYVLVCKEPEYLLVGITGNQSVLNPEVKRRITEILRRDFHDKRFDDGLMAAVKLVRERLSSSK